MAATRTRMGATILCHAPTIPEVGPRNETRRTELILLRPSSTTSLRAVNQEVINQIAWCDQHQHKFHGREHTPRSKPTLDLVALLKCIVDKMQRAVHTANSYNGRLSIHSEHASSISSGITSFRTLTATCA